MASKSYIVEFIKFAAKQTQKLPKFIQEAVFLWNKSVETFGLPEIRKSKGYHDEPVKGDRKGQRSIRLNRSYRLIYTETETDEIIIVGIQEVNKHEY